MAEAIIVNGVGEIVQRLVSFGFNEIGLMLGVKHEVQNLQSILNNIQAVLQDAEKKQVEQETLRVWLNDLKQVAYDAEDVLDEIAYEESRRSIKNNKVSNLFSSSNPLALRFKIAHKIEDINKRLGDINKRKNMFQLISSANGEHDTNGSFNLDQMNFRETSSLVDDSTVVGRDSDKGKMVNLLLGRRSSCNTNNQEATGSNIALSVIPIVGFGGLGKTTLAQLAYNDEVVKEHFDLRVWICVSNNFDATNLFAQIIEQISPDISDSRSSSKQVLQNKLERYLAGKRFLLVLDDLWDEDQEKWDDFILPFTRFGAIGSKIIITTRSHVVASITGARNTLQLQILSEESCWILFERRAFMPGGAQKTSNLVKIGKEIVKKCQGVPLAAKVLGGLMHSKKEEREWVAAQDAEIWNVTSNGENKIMKVLKLSYDNLPAALKLCFSYCAIFPKDYWISRESLIQLWMAQGLLGAASTRGGSLIMEDLGNSYLNILYSKSFFQEAKMNKFGEVAYCKMHDLVHDLAQSIREAECQVVGETNRMKIDLSKCQHASLSSSTIVKALNGDKNIRTVLNCRAGDFYGLMFSKSCTFDNFRLLRVLDLSYSNFHLCPSPGKFKLMHLRYLDLSFTWIQSLPKWVTQLYNLQTLKLHICFELSELNLTNLKRLRHLYVDEGAYRKKMPQGMGELYFLQTLTLVVAGEEDGGRDIAMLENLNDLHGSLEMYALHHIKEASTARRANLNGKEHLRELVLDWHSSVHGSWCVDIDLRSTDRGVWRKLLDRRSTICSDDVVSVFEELRPHSNLKWLSIKNFAGARFPQWASSGSALPNLVSLCISKCGGCKHIPSFGELPCLEALEIKDMRDAKRMGGSWDASQSSLALYPSLKRLHLWRMGSLKEWLEDAVIFSCLEEMSIKNCPSLRRAPHLFPSLKSLELDNVGGKGVVSITSSLTSLASLAITSCEDLEFLSEAMLQMNQQLEVMHVTRCPKLRYFLPLDDSREVQEMMVVKRRSLHELEINECVALKSIPDVRGFTSLRKLTINRCPQLETIPKGFLSSLVSLENLYIGGCLKLNQNMSENGEYLFPSLRRIDFSCLKSISMLVEFGKNNNLNSITQLKISQIEELTTLPAELFQSFVSLRELEITECRELQSLQSLQFLTALERMRLGPFSEELHCFPLPIESNNLLPSLQKLEIFGWPTLKSLPDQLQRLTTLKSLGIYYFYGLTVLPEWLGNLTLLQRLYIVKCENLLSLPSKEQMQRLASLNKLSIDGCLKLETRCMQLNSPEWPKISHIPNVQMSLSRSRGHTP